MSPTPGRVGFWGTGGPGGAGGRRDGRAWPAGQGVNVAVTGRWSESVDVPTTASVNVTR